MKISNTVLDILGNSKVQDNILYLPDVQLDRADYVAVNKVLEALGGKWNRKAKGHVFDHCPADDIETVILTGEITSKKKEYQFFPTPADIAEQLCDLAEIDSNTAVMEPSCGQGNIADAAWNRGPAKLLGIELNTDMEKHLAQKPYETRVGVDFLQYSDGVFVPRHSRDVFDDVSGQGLTEGEILVCELILRQRSAVFIDRG